MSKESPEQVITSVSAIDSNKPMLFTLSDTYKALDKLMYLQAECIFRVNPGILRGAVFEELDNRALTIKFLLHDLMIKGEKTKLLQKLSEEKTIIDAIEPIADYDDDLENLKITYDLLENYANRMSFFLLKVFKALDLVDELIRTNTVTFLVDKDDRAFIRGFNSRSLSSLSSEDALKYILTIVKKLQGVKLYYTIERPVENTDPRRKTLDYIERISNELSGIAAEMDTYLLLNSK